MICAMCLFNNPADAEVCVQCQRMRFSTRPRTAVADRDHVRLDKPKADTAFDLAETCIDWTAIRADDPPG